MKKWYTVLWVVLASLALSSVLVVVFRRPAPHEISIAKVNGRKISVQEYRQVFNGIRAQIETYKNYARAYGVSVDMFLNLAGLNNPEQAAFDRCVKNELLDIQKDEFDIQMDPKFFGKELYARLPFQLKDKLGNLDMKAYEFYLNRQFTTIPEYEKRMEDEFERELFQTFINNSYYIPINFVKDDFEQGKVKKSFEIVTIPFDHFLSLAKKETVDTKALKAYFDKNKENYRSAEKRKANFWHI